MDRQTHLMINDAGYNAEPTRSWSSLAKSLVGAASQLVGNVVGVQAQVAHTRTQASGMDFQAAGHGMDSARLTEMSLINASLQRATIRAEEMHARVASADKWLWRFGAVKSGYAAAGVAVDVGTPLAVRGKLLEAYDQEKRLISLNAKIQEINRAFIPSMQAKTETLRSDISRDLAEGEAMAYRDTARAQRTAGLISAGAQALDVVGGLF